MRKVLLTVTYPFAMISKLINYHVIKFEATIKSILTNLYFLMKCT